MSDIYSGVKFIAFMDTQSSIFSIFLYRSIIPNQEIIMNLFSRRTQWDKNSPHEMKNARDSQGVWTSSI